MNTVLPRPPTPPSSPPQPPSSGTLTLDVPNLLVAEEMVCPLENKHKTNEGDGEIGNRKDDEEDDEYDSEEHYCTKAGGKMDKHLWESYYQQIKESQGFDIEDFPGRCWMTTVFPLPYYLTDPKNVIKLKDYASKALKQYNDSKGTSYEVDEILKVNGGGCRSFIYYITFSVKTASLIFFKQRWRKK